MPSGTSNTYATPTSFCVCRVVSKPALSICLPSLSTQVREVLKDPGAVRLKRAVVFVQREPHVDFPDGVVLADVVDRHLHAAQSLRFAGRVGQIVEAELHLPARHERMQLAVERGDSFHIARRQVERQRDLGRLRAVRHFHVQIRFRLS